MWLEPKTIALKKGLLAIGTITILIGSLLQQVLFIPLFFLLGGLGLLLFIMLRDGLFVRVHTCTVHGLRKEVVDFIDFRNFKNNFRGMRTLGSRTWDALTYKSHQNRWKYLDIIRIHMETLNLKKKNHILILGGGAGALSESITKTFPQTTVTNVEIFPIYKQIAYRFFSNSADTDVRWIIADAFEYVQRSARGLQYDYIIVDMFINDKFLKNILAFSFQKQLIKMVNPSGKIVINFGIPKQTPPLLLRYPSITSRYQVYWVGGNLMAFTTRLPQGRFQSVFPKPFQRVTKKSHRSKVSHL